MDTDPKSQKAALKKLLESKYGVVKTEANFDWLIVPNSKTIIPELNAIVDGLSKYRGFNSFFTAGKLLECDYYIPSNKLIIEYDERQHFTIPRAISLKNYPHSITLGFDKNKWITACEKIRAIDNDPFYRDEQRAFYDSLRDILTARNGITLIRIKDRDFDWESKDKEKQLNEMVSAHSKIARIIPLQKSR